MRATKSPYSFLTTIVYLSLIFFPRILYGQAVDIEAAKKEGKVVVYGLVPPNSMAAINKAFEAKYGIKVEYWRAAPNKVLDRVLTEWRAGHPAFDVIESNRAAQLLTKQERVFTRFVPTPSEKFPAQFKEKDGLISSH